MKEIKIKLYDYDELDKKAQERALQDWNKDNYDPFMQSHMVNLLGETLDERDIEYGYPGNDLDVRYSLSHCQGDGFMFIGELTYKGKRVNVEHDGNPHYYHEYTASFTFEEEDAWTAEEEDAFKKEYLDVCKHMEQEGYDYIKYQTSEEAFRQSCEANEYTFEADGRMRNV